MNDLAARNFKRWRKTLGWSQTDAAHRLRCSRDTIASIESGRLELSPRMAMAVECISGCWFASLKSKHGPRGFDARPFSYEHYEAHKDLREQAVLLSKQSLQPA